MDILAVLQQEADRKEQAVALIRQGLQMLEALTVVNGGSPGRVTMVAPGAAYRKDYRSQVVEDLRRHGKSSPATIAKRLGCKTAAIDSFLFRELRRKDSVVKKVSEGVYDVTAAARKAREEGAA